MDAADPASRHCYAGKDAPVRRRKPHPDEPKWFRYRGYVHFDRRIPCRVVERYVTSPDAVCQHGFWPFVRFVKSIPRYHPETRSVAPKERPISYAAHLDAHIYAWYANKLTVRLEEVFASEPCGPSVLAYRSLGKSNIHFAKEAFADIERLAPCTAKMFDIEGLFDNLDHGYLKRAWCSRWSMDRLPEDHYRVFRSVTQYAYVEQESLCKALGIEPCDLRKNLDRLCSPAKFRRAIRDGGLIRVNNEAHGIPQGSPISAVLSNIYLLDFDRRMHSLAAKTGGIYRRYSDDILWICPVGTEDTIEKELQRQIARCHLAIQSAKTETRKFDYDAAGVLITDRHVQYLGFTFDGQRTLIRSNTLARYYRRMKRGVRAAKRKAAAKGNPCVYRRSLYKSYTHLGSWNFVSYAQRAARIMTSDPVRRQIGRHWRKLHQLLETRD